MSQSLAALSMTACSARPAAVNLDCLSSMVRLQLLEITAWHNASVWTSGGQLSLLTSLQSFRFKSGQLQGPVWPALDTLPYLTRLETCSVPESSIDLGGMSYTALKKLKIHIKCDDYDDRYLDLGVGDLDSPLQQLSLISLTLPYKILPLKLLFRLEKLYLNDVDASKQRLSHEWPEDATQLRSLSLVRMKLIDFPESGFDLNGLQDLILNHNELSDLPDALTQLSHLTLFSLDGNLITTMPKVISKMTHLCHLAFRNCYMGMLITQSLTYFTAFSHLEHLVVSCGSEWDIEGVSHSVSWCTGPSLQNGLLESMATSIFSDEGN